MADKVSGGLKTRIMFNHEGHKELHEGHKGDYIILKLYVSQLQESETYIIPYVLNKCRNKIILT